MANGRWEQTRFVGYRSAQVVDMFVFSVWLDSRARERRIPTPDDFNGTMEIFAQFTRKRCYQKVASTIRSREALAFGKSVAFEEFSSISNGESERCYWTIFKNG